MYNVIVAYDSTAWETDELMRMDADRFKEYSGGPEADQIDLKKPATLKLLEAVPTLLFYEQGAKGPTADIVRYGHVSGVQRRVARWCFASPKKAGIRRRCWKNSPRASTSHASSATALTGP